MKREPKKQQRITRSFEHAYRGMVDAVRTQRNMRFHVLAAAAVLALSLLAGVSRVELAVLVIVIVGVMVAEMFNTAIESVVDLATDEYHALAKLAKDASAGAVLVASIGAVAVGYLVLADDLGKFTLETLNAIRRWPGHLTLVALVLATLLVLAIKALTHSPRAFMGGMPSGHAAVAFSGWVAASFIAADTQYAGLISLITLLMALLVCQSRIESGIHGILQVVAGTAIGVLVTVAVFQFL